MERKKHQEAFTVLEQIENLKALNLTIKDEAFAMDFLNDVSYFRFIKAYSLGLKPKNGSYYDGITFEQLVELYLFNAITNIRIFGVLICLKHILPADRHWIEFIDTIELLFEKYPHVEKNTMGFPTNWMDILKK